MIKDKLQERKITYTLEVNGQLIVVENVPARVNVETGEQLFSPRRWSACSRWSGAPHSVGGIRADLPSGPRCHSESEQVVILNAVKNLYHAT